MYAVILIVLVSLALLCSELMETSIKMFSQYDPLLDKSVESGSTSYGIMGILIAVFLSILIYLLVKVGLDQFGQSVGNIFHPRREFPDESTGDYGFHYQKIRTKLSDWYTVCRQWLRTKIKRQPKDAISNAGVNDITTNNTENLQQKK